MAHDDLDHIPAITATRDGVPRNPRANTRGSQSASKGRKPERPSSAEGVGLFARLFITVALVVGAVACAWAWQLQERLEQSGHLLERYEERISDLEDRLSDTDEGLNQNSATMAVKIKELYSEVDKLWASAWRKNKAQIEALQKQGASTTKKAASSEKVLASNQTQLKSMTADIAKLKSVTGDLDRLMASAKTNQAEVERVADTLNRMNLDIAKLDKEVQGNEEWTRSVDAFRRQVNSTLTRLQASIRSLEAAP
ncbi:MAG: chromosome segregation ATPase [Halioglobus sp.]|jgi:chromosome segregation ATPase